MATVQAILGLLVFVGIAFALSERRGDVRWKPVAIGLAMQVALALLFLKLPYADEALLFVNQGVIVLEEVTLQATQFMFGYLAGGELPFEETREGASFIVAFRVLPLILVVSAISAVLFHWGVLPRIISLLARGLQRSFRTSGALGFAASSSIFFGIIESPLLIKPYLERLQRAELFALMTCGMATVAGTVMVLYASVIGSVIPGALGHILVASVVSVPAALLLSHVMIPNEASDEPTEPFEYERETESAMDALMKGTADGTQMVISIIATIIVLFALVYLTNRGLALLPFEEPLDLQTMVGWIFRPLLWLTGMTWAETAYAGPLFGTKTVLNEFVAYLQFAGSSAEELSERSRLIVTYAMCGFANLGSLGILVGGLGAIMPDRRTEIAELAARAVVAGSLATLMTGAVVGLIA